MSMTSKEGVGTFLSHFEDVEMGEIR